MDNYEQKYKKALESVKFLQEVNPSDEGIQNWVKDNFPELKEPENERIRKAIICGMYTLKENQKKKTFADIPLDDCITWLEKQGETFTKKDVDDAYLKGVCDAKHELEKQDKQPTDNDEPKFKVGDWVVYDHRPYQVVELPKEGYINLGLKRNGKVEFAPSTYCRHWSIQDAKDGDVLFHSDSASNGIFIFKEILQRGTIQKVVCHCDYDSEDGFCLGENHTCCWTNSKILHPATKEQRDTLEMAMTNAGYTFDFDKKDLKKIKPKTLDPDKVIEWIECKEFQGWAEPIDIRKIIRKFKKDFGL